ncbi:MAG: methylmalonyl-CoA mutase subunit beta [Bacteroidota bacterium]
MTKQLFNNFETVSPKAWKQKIQADLKGADFNEKLVTKTQHGIDIKPFYTKEDQTELPSISPNSKWSIAEKFTLADAKTVLNDCKDVLARGAECLWLVITKKSTNVVELLQGLDLVNTPVFIDVESYQKEELNQLTDFLKQNKHCVYLGFDPIHKLASTGNWLTDKETDFADFKKYQLDPKNEFYIHIDSRLYQNAGGNIPQQLAYALAHLNEYLNFISQNKLTQKIIINFELSIGSHYFFEIAKLKALRVLVKTLTDEYGFATKTHIIAEPSKRNKTLYDYNVNMLRTTTECMSAVLGGADVVSNLAYDEIFHHPNEFGERISRNQLLLLKEESNFDKVINPTEGAYYIENLTEQLAQNALDIFKQIENGNGFINQLFEGKIQKKIKEQSDEEIDKVVKAEFKMVGSNTYINPEDKMKNEVEKEAFVTKNPRKTLIQPIIAKRLTESIEKKRLAEEQ